MQSSLEQVGLSSAALDRSTDPCRDFYQYACGGWIAKAEMPADQSWWSRVPEMRERTEAELQKILEHSSKNPGSDPVAHKIGGFYASCMDEDAVEKAGMGPIRPLLQTARAVHDARSLTSAVATLHTYEIGALFGIWVEPDLKDATQMVAALDQDGLGLPERDYYLKSDGKSVELREKYARHIERMMTLAGASKSEAQESARDAMKVETEIARISQPRVERRDPSRRYNRVDRPGLVRLTPRFHWDDYFKGIGHPDTQQINVASLAFFEGVNRLVQTIEWPAWRHYLAWQAIHRSAAMLPRAFVEENFTLEHQLTGQQEIPARWKRCVQATDDALTQLLAQPYVQSNLTNETKAAAEALVRELAHQFARELEELTWMDGKTRERALEKLRSAGYLVGYPARWKSYDFEMTRTFGENMLAALKFELSHELDKVGRRVDRQEWPVSPATVNAFYEPWKNNMVFPAGILQPPFFSSAASLAANFGAFGSLAGHEVTHGFDDQGSKFGRDGNLENWWEPETRERFRAKTKCLEEQYGAYEALPGLKLNGELTLGENIADLGGVVIAFRAYRAMSAASGEMRIADGFSEDQQFFLAFAQAWCSKVTEEQTRLNVQVDEHSPPKFRINGSLANLVEFAQAFSCAEGMPMRPAKTCRVW